MRTCLALLAAAALLAGCKPSADVAPAQASLASRAATPPAPEAPKDREVSGSVFTATKGGSVVKLAAVEVKAYEWEAVNKEMEFSRKVAESLVEKTKLSALEMAKAAAAALTAAADARVARARAGAATLGSEATSRAAAMRPFEARVEEAEAKHLVLKADADKEWALYQEFQRLALSGEDGLRDLKDGLIRIAVTDAEGAFKLRLPSDRQVVLVARAKRLVGRTEEKYLWAHTVPKDEPGPVHLSNANLLR